jgi:serine/threonine protein kinase
MIGRTISHYRVVGKLGVGGMGVVYDAEDQNLARKVALKFLPDELAGTRMPPAVSRREAQTIALLNHPQICTVYEVDEFETAPL